MQTNPTWRTPPKLYREPSKRVLGGVAAGIAEHLRMPVVAVRVSFIVLLAANGLGALLYVAFWGVLPVRPDAAPSPRSARSLLQGAGLVALAAGILIALYQSG